jgi:hypothetical protein
MSQVAEGPGSLTRRTFVVGTGLGLLSACSDDAEESEVEARRRRRRRRRGRGNREQGAADGRTVLTQTDLEQVASRLTELLDGDDLDAFLAYARPSDTTGWRWMWQGLHEVPTTDRRFLLQSAEEGWANDKGGPVNVTVRGVVAYRIEGCDGEPMAHLCDLSVYKAPNGRVRVQTLGPLREKEAAPWLLTPVSAVAAGHVVLIAREADAALARRLVGEVDRGAARALDFLPPPAGVSKICVTLGWPEARDTLYGGSRTEFIGSSHNYRYVDPQVLADTGRRGQGETFRGSRVIVDPGAMAAQGAQAVTAHESVHALAFQWGQGAPPLYAEGLARYVEAGTAQITRAARQLGAEEFRRFARRVTARPGRAAFYDATWLATNYTCAAMMCVHVVDRHGEVALRDLVRAAYEGAPDPARTVLGISQGALLREVAARLEPQKPGRSGTTPSASPTEASTGS